MPLTPEDVLNKTFGTTQFRRGYDEREVDDFLDEVVASLRSLTAELDNCRAGGVGPSDGVGADGDLHAKLQREIALRKEAERALAQAQEQGGAADQARAADVTDHPAPSAGEERLVEIEARIADAEQEASERIAAAQARAEEAEAEARRRIEEADAAAAPVGVQDTAPQPLAASGEAMTTSAADASGLIALAQRVHDEYVAQGESTRDQLITEAQSRHDELISGAQEMHDALLAEASEQSEGMVGTARDEAAAILGAANQQREQVLGDLEGQRTGLEQTLETLRGYEQEYRGRIREYFQEQLRHVEQLSWQPPAADMATNEDAVEASAP
ncbi:MAG: DivIVA domain-containing protein [Tetrasphaera sp.]